MTYPSLEEIKKLHKKLALNDQVFQRVFIHCEIINKIALHITEKNALNINLELINSGSLLHDIGAYEFFNKEPFNEKEYIRHGIVGYNILKDLDFPQELCRIASHHTGVGIQKEEIIRDNLPLPHEDFLADTLEEKIIMYADKFHSKHPQFNTYESYRNKILKFGLDKMKIFELMAQEFGIPEIQNLAKEYNMPLV